MLGYQMRCYFGVSSLGAPIAVLNLFIQRQADKQALIDHVEKFVFALKFVNVNSRIASMHKSSLALDLFAKAIAAYNAVDYAA